MHIGIAAAINHYNYDLLPQIAPIISFYTYVSGTVSNHKQHGVNRSQDKGRMNHLFLNSKLSCSFIFEIEFLQSVSGGLLCLRTQTHNRKTPNMRGMHGMPSYTHANVLAIVPTSRTVDSHLDN